MTEFKNNRLSQDTVYAQSENDLQNSTYPQNNAYAQSNNAYQQNNGFAQSNNAYQQDNGFSQNNNGYQQNNGFAQSNNAYQQNNGFVQSNNGYQQSNDFVQNNGGVLPNNGLPPTSGLPQYGTQAVKYKDKNYKAFGLAVLNFFLTIITLFAFDTLFYYLVFLAITGIVASIKDIANKRIIRGILGLILNIITTGIYALVFIGMFASIGA